MINHYFFNLINSIRKFNVNCNFQIRLYLNRVLMSTIGLEVFEKPINFQNILNVRNQLIFKNCNKFIDLFSDYCLNDDLSLGYNQI